jgi:hypothetical protein
MRARRHGLLFLAGVLAVAVAASAASQIAFGDTGQLGKLVGKVVRQRYGELHRCYRKALARDRSKGGTVFLKVTLGADDRVARAKVAKDEIGQRSVTRCLEGAVGGWTFPGAARAGAVSGSELYLPLTFRGDPDQRAVAAADLGWPPRYDGAVALLTARNCGATFSATLARTQTVAESLPSRSRLLVLLSGRATVGKRGRSVPSVVLLPAGSNVELEPDKRVTLLSLSLPAALAAKARPRFLVLGRRPRTLAKGISVRLLRLAPRAKLRHAGRGRRVLYVLSGSARLGPAKKTRSASRPPTRIGPNTAVFWPKGHAATLTAVSATKALEVRLP